MASRERPAWAKAACKDRSAAERLLAPVGRMTAARIFSFSNRTVSAVIEPISIPATIIAVYPLRIEIVWSILPAEKKDKERVGGKIS
jgi:hypothetical protein